MCELSSQTRCVVSHAREFSAFFSAPLHLPLQTGLFLGIVVRSVCASLSALLFNLFIDLVLERLSHLLDAQHPSSLTSLPLPTAAIRKGHRAS